MMIAQVLSLLLLVLDLDRAKADDGCENDEYWKCGDICIDMTASCQCGNTTIDISDNTWCCGTGCDRDGDWWGSDARCLTGEVLPLTQTCHGVCNHHPWDEHSNYIGVRSHVPIECDNMTRCLPEQVCNGWDDYMCLTNAPTGCTGCASPSPTQCTGCVSRAPTLCTGAPPVCTDRQDIKACWEEGNNQTCHMSIVVPGAGFPDPSYTCKNGPCVYNNTGVYECPLRDDEATITNDEESDGNDSDLVPHMEPCVQESDQMPGLMCGGICENVTNFCDPDNNYEAKLSPECLSTVNRTNISAMKHICDQVPHMEPCVHGYDVFLSPGLMCGGICEKLDYFCDPNNRYEADLSPDCRADLTVTRANICQNQIFARLGREFYKSKSMLRSETLCGGVWPGETVGQGRICDGDMDCSDGGDEVCTDEPTKWNREAIAGYTLCSDNHTRISPTLVCDGVYQCPGQDIQDEDATVCRQNYERLGIAPSLGSFECVSNDIYRNPNLTILSVRCDGKIQCLGGKDEENCKDSSLFVGFIVAFSALPAILFFGWTGYRWSLKSRMEDEMFSGPQTRDATSMTKLLEMLLGPKPDISSNSSSVVEFSGQDISIAFFHIQKMDYNKRKTATKRFMDSIGRTEASRLWMKKHLHPDAISFILLNCDESFVDRLLPNWIKTNFLGAAGQFGQVLAFLKTGYASFSTNLDLFFDCVLLVLLYRIVTEQVNMVGLLLIVLCAMASVIFIPMFYEYCALFKNSNKKFLLFCFPIFPLVTHLSTLKLMCRQATIQLQIDNMTMSSTSSFIQDRTTLANKICDTADKLWKKVMEVEDVKSVIDKRRLLETSAEGQPQSYIKGILLLLTLSLTQSAYIPATIFGKNIEFFGIPSNLILMVFILNPILMNGNYYLGAICNKRTTLGSIFLVLFIFACILGKFVGIVAIFSPPLGLFSILGHWKEQQTPFSCDVMIPPNGDGFFYGVVQGAVTRTNWTDIGGPLCKNGTDYVDIESRNTNSTWQPEEPSTYFLFDLEATCVFIALVIFARLIAIYKAKMWFASDFSEKTLFVRIKHILYSGLGAVPLTWSNWEDANTLPNISLVFRKERLERMVLLTIHLFENILLLLPMVYTWFKIQARHTILENSIGTTELEKMSYTNAFRLVVGSFFFVLLCFLIEIILFPIYYRFAHIWRELLNHARLLGQEKKNWKEIEIEGGKQVLCSEPAKKTTGDVKPIQNVAKHILDDKEDDIKHGGGKGAKMHYEFSVRIFKQ